jgi:hypothetical protein
MKTFKDIVFEKHDLAKSVLYGSIGVSDTLGFKDMIQSKVIFDSGKTISVIGGGPTYGDGVNTFEVMDSDGEVHGHLTKDEVTELMIKEQNYHIIKKHRMT